VGLGRFELPTSRLSSARSNQLSYKPLGQETVISRRTSATASSATLLAGRRPLIPDWARPRRKRNGDGGVPPSGIRGQIVITRSLPTAALCCSKAEDRAKSSILGTDFRPLNPGILRKEVIQPQVPLRLPCYDFTPVADPTVVGCLPCGLAHRLQVKPTPMV
jgi:hypothetical protein